MANNSNDKTNGLIEKKNDIHTKTVTTALQALDMAKAHTYCKVVKLI